MKWQYLLLGFIIFCKSVLPVAAQDGCEVTLNMATDEFNTGHFYGVPELIGPCLDGGQNREWRQRAYLLLTQAYLLLDDPIGAKNSYLKVLEANPEYVPNADRDPIDLVYFSTKFTTSPLFSLFSSTGGNISLIKVLKDVGTFPQNPEFESSISKKYSLRPGFQIGAGVEWHYDENLSATVGIDYVRSAYKKTTSKIFGRDKIEIVDRQNWFRLPIAVKFSDHVGKYRPYGYIGFSFDYLTSDKATITTVNNDSLTGPNPFNSQTSESPPRNFTSKRNRFNQSIFIGGGVKYKLGLNYAFIDLRYSLGLRNIVDDKKLYYEYDGADKTSDSFLKKGESVFAAGYVDDLFRMNNLMISIGYIHPLYKPRELKRAKTKSILRRIKKHDDKR